MTFVRMLGAKGQAKSFDATEDNNLVPQFHDCQQREWCQLFTKQEDTRVWCALQFWVEHSFEHLLRELGASHWVAIDTQEMAGLGEGSFSGQGKKCDVVGHVVIVGVMHIYGVSACSGLVDGGGLVGHGRALHECAGAQCCHGCLNGGCSGVIGCLFSGGGCWWVSVLGL